MTQITVGSDEYKELLRRQSDLQHKGHYIGVTARERTELFNIERALTAAELAHDAQRETAISSLRLCADPIDYDLMMAAGDLGGAEIDLWDMTL